MKRGLHAVSVMKSRAEDSFAQLKQLLQYPDKGMSVTY